MLLSHYSQINVSSSERMPKGHYSKGYESILIKTLGASPKLRIIDFFLDNSLFDFTKKRGYRGIRYEQTDFLQIFS